MHRQALLQALDCYGRRHPEEADCGNAFRRFVERYEHCFERALTVPGHVTGSAWIVDPEGQSVLLTHHRKLDLWIQLGGHADGDSDVCRVARREGLEESGLESLELLQPREHDAVSVAVPFDLDIHEIPARKQEPAHLHFDVRYAFVAPHRRVRVSKESKDLAWVPVAELAATTQDESVLRMARKWQSGSGLVAVT